MSTSNEILPNICEGPVKLVYPPIMPDWITTHEACEILRVHKYTLYAWAEKNLVKMKRSPVLNYRLFELGSVEALAKTLPKKREAGNRVFPFGGPKKKKR